MQLIHIVTYGAQHIAAGFDPSLDNSYFHLFDLMLCSLALTDGSGFYRTQDL